VPESITGFERWRVLGRLLPSEVRERVFEPAFADLMRDELTVSQRPARASFGLRATGMCLRCLPIAVPQIFLKRGRLTRFGRASMWVAAVLVTVALVVANMRHAYASYDP